MENVFTTIFVSSLCFSLNQYKATCFDLIFITFKKMLSPRTKANIKKYRKGRISDHLKSRGGSCNFGTFGLQSKSAGLFTSRQIEATRKVLKKHLKKRGRLWLNVFPDVAKTKKPEKTRMGKGKGRTHLWCFKVHPGKILFEIGGLSLKNARIVFKKASYKLPFFTRSV
jgi:large subunit ribosomal protein L16